MTSLLWFPCPAYTALGTDWFDLTVLPSKGECGLTVEEGLTVTLTLRVFWIMIKN